MHRVIATQAIRNRYKDEKQTQKQPLLIFDEPPLGNHDFDEVKNLQRNISHFVAFKMKYCLQVSFVPSTSKVIVKGFLFHVIYIY